MQQTTSNSARPKARAEEERAAARGSEAERRPQRGHEAGIRKRTRGGQRTSAAWRAGGRALEQSGDMQPMRGRLLIRRAVPAAWATENGGHRDRRHAAAVAWNRNSAESLVPMNDGHRGWQQKSRTGRWQVAVEPSLFVIDHMPMAFRPGLRHFTVVIVIVPNNDIPRART